MNPNQNIFCMHHNRAHYSLSTSIYNITQHWQPHQTYFNNHKHNNKQTTPITSLPWYEGPLLCTVVASDTLALQPLCTCHPLPTHNSTNNNNSTATIQQGNCFRLPYTPAYPYPLSPLRYQSHRELDMVRLHTQHTPSPHLPHLTR